jgi:hypothetical protein
MRHAQFVMTGMVLFDEDGVATYDGPQQIEPGLPAIRELRLFDAFEGHAGWIVGYDGPGCLVPLERDEAGVLAFEVPHPPG